jgi:hypothetical protein
MKDLKPAQAEKIVSIIMHSGDTALIKALQSALTHEAEMRQGMGGMDAAWHGTSLPAFVTKALGHEFGIKQLYDRNVLSADGTLMEMRVLAGALPEKAVAPYFHFDVKERCESIGRDLEDFKKDLKSVFRGTVGTPGGEDFGILLDKKVLSDMGAYFKVLGLGMLAHPYDKATCDRLSKRADLSETFRVAVAQGFEVADRKIDPNSVYLVTPHYSAQAVKIISDLLELPQPPLPPQKPPGFKL